MVSSCAVKFRDYLLRVFMPDMIRHPVICGHGSRVGARNDKQHRHYRKGLLHERSEFGQPQPHDHLIRRADLQCEFAAMCACQFARQAQTQSMSFSAPIA